MHCIFDRKECGVHECVHCKNLFKHEGHKMYKEILEGFLKKIRVRFI